MSVEQITDSLTRLPKVELHVHLEGATDAETVWTMAQRNGVSLPADSLESWRQHYKFQDFSHFIDVYTAAARAMRTPEDWSFMVERFMHSQSQQNIVYSEVFLSTSHQIGKLPLDEWVDALCQGAANGEKHHGTRIQFIADISRHMPDTQEAVLECAVEAADTEYFVGLGLGGVEEGFPASLFEDTYREARRLGLRVVAHAGETTGARTVQDAVRILKAERIGHGIRCLDDADLVAELRDTQLPLEVCPTSNYCLGVVERDRPHPLRRMVDAGLFCTVNSDDPPMFDTTLIDEYKLLARQGFRWNELIQLNLNAVDASFMPNDEKAQLRAQIHAVTNGTDP